MTMPASSDVLRILQVDLAGEVEDIDPWASVGEAHRLEQLSSTVSAYTRQHTLDMQRIESGVRVLRGRVENLDNRVQTLETLHDEVAKLKREISRASPARQEEGASSDKYSEWLEAHQADLKAYPRCYVAIDLKKGILFAEKDEAAFLERLGKLDDRQRSAIYT